MRDLRPMLAATLEPTMLEGLNYPFLLSPKLDGFRCLTLGGVALSKNLKPIRNRFVQYTLGRSGIDFLDGELIVGSPTDPLCFNTTSSGVTTAAGEPDFTFYVFDTFREPAEEFTRRFAKTQKQARAVAGFNVVTVPHEMVENARQLLKAEQKYLKAGYEGVMLRHPRGPYKFGRSTATENWLWKFKRFTDFEVRITGLEEAQENGNEAFKDELGRTKRSSHKENKRGKAMVGGLRGVDLRTGKSIKVSPGKMSHVKRIHYWAHPDELLGQVATVRVFEYGAKDADRFPRFYALRHEDDV